jgi:two-component system, cell cycle sensor histidine kinase and response regulator CckA
MSKAGQGRSPLRHSDGSAAERVMQISRKVAATIGTDFFRAMAKHLADALDATCVLVGEFTGGYEERCRSVAAWLDGEPAELEFPLAESAIAQVVLGKPCLWRSDVQTRFPSDTLLKQTKAQACIAVPLTDDNHQPQGVLAALYRLPAQSLRAPKAMLEIFAERASAELSRKREDDALRKSEQRYRAFIARNADAMWRVEYDPPVPTNLSEQEQFDLMNQCGFVAECNDATARLLGLEKAEQLIGSKVSTIAPATDPTSREATFIAIRSGYRLTTVETSPRDGHGNRRHMLRSQWGIVEDGKLERMWGSNRDITELRRVETALSASEQRMADLIESMRMLVLMLDDKGAVSFCNNYLSRLTGWDSRDLLGKDWLETMVPSEERNRVRADFARGALNPDAPVHFESAVLCPDGRRRRFSWDSTILRGPDGENEGWAIIGRDITEFSTLEEQFRQAQKLASIGKLAGGLAHDFNNLLTVISGYTSTLLTKLSPADATYTSLVEVRKAAEKAAHLAHGLLTFSRRQALRPQVVQVNAIVEDAVSMLRTLLGHHVHLVTNLDRCACLVRIDAGYFHQALVNLAINARDAMPNGGTLTIATANVKIDGPQPSATAVPSGDYVEVTVTDNGTGMTDEVREHLFEPFFTTKEIGKGTGLGLSTVYGIVMQSGGHIFVDSEVGRGTTFRIYLPGLSPERAPAEVPEIRELPGGTETILLAQSEERSMPATVLGHLGYMVLNADSPAQVIEVCRDQIRKIDLLIVNLDTLELRGDELADLVKTFRPEIKIMYASGLDDPSAALGAGTPGIAVLRKPFTPLALAEKVREILDRSEGA